MAQSLEPVSDSVSPSLSALARLWWVGLFLCIHNVTNCLMQEGYLSLYLGYQHVFLTELDHFFFFF